MKSERIPTRSYQSNCYSISHRDREKRHCQNPQVSSNIPIIKSIMTDTSSNIISLPQTHEPNLLHALDPISLILNQNSHGSDHPFPLKLTSLDSFIMERGPNYAAYAALRETRLHTKCLIQEQQREESLELEQPTKLANATTTPPRKKHVKFQSCEGNTKGSSFVVGQSVPDFSAALRKENRKPVNHTLPSTMMEMTPPFKSDGNGVSLSSRGSKSASGGEKKKGYGGGGVMVARKSYACIDELKNMSSAMATAINGEGRGGGRSSRMTGKTISGKHRLF